MDTTDSNEYLIDKITVYLYPSYLAPVFDSKEEGKNTYPILGNYYLPYLNKKFKVSSLFYNTNSVNFLNSINKIKFYNDIFEFKKRLYLIEFNIKEEAFDKSFVNKIKLYSLNNKLNYQNNYNNLNINNLEKINFIKADVYNDNIFIMIIYLKSITK